MAPPLKQIRIPGSVLFAVPPFFSASHASRTSWLSHNTTPSIFRPFGIRPSRHHSSNFVSETAKEAAASSRLSTKRGSDIATRYDKTARNFLAAIDLAATIIWLN
jgi:transposase